MKGMPIYLLYRDDTVICASESIRWIRAALESRVHKKEIRYMVNGDPGFHNVIEQIRALRSDWKGGIISQREFNDRLDNGRIAIVKDGEIFEKVDDLDIPISKLAVNRYVRKGGRAAFSPTFKTEGETAVFNEQDIRNDTKR